MKLLIVEDESSLRELLARALRKEQYVVETASTYAEARTNWQPIRMIVSYWTLCCRTATGCNFSSVFEERINAKT